MVHAMDDGDAKTILEEARLQRLVRRRATSIGAYLARPAPGHLVTKGLLIILRADHSESRKLLFGSETVLGGPPTERGGRLSAQY